MKTEKQSKSITRQERALTSAAIYLTEGELAQNRTNKDRPAKIKGLGLALKATEWLPNKFLIWSFATIKLISSREVLLINNLIIIDHESGTINRSIKRAAKGIELQSRHFKIRRRDAFRSIVLNLEEMTRAFTKANPKTARGKERVLRLVTFYAYWAYVLEATKPKAVCIAFTSDQRRLALGIAANEHSIPTACWCVEKYLTREIPPFFVDTQFCWSLSQTKQAIQINAKPVQMPVQLKTRQRADEASLRKGGLGLLLNAKAKKHRVKQFLYTLQKDFGICDIKVRPHPGSTLTQRDIGDAGILADWLEPLETYFQTIQGALSMTSGVINEALWSGLPTAFVGGLDDYEGDLQGFTKQGAIPELLPGQDPIELLISYRANRGFFENRYHREFSNDPVAELEEIKRLFTP